MSTLKVTNLQHGSATAPAISVAVGGGATVLGITTFHNNVDLLDDDRLRLGAGQDLQIYHNSSNNNTYIQESGGGQLIIQTNAFRLLNAAGSENMIDADEDGAAKLYHNGSTKLETSSYGAWLGDNSRITLGGSAGTPDCHFYHDATDTNIQNVTGDLVIKSNSNGDKAIVVKNSAATEVYYANSKKFETTSAGVSVNGLAAIQGAQFNANITPSSGSGVEVFEPSSTVGQVQAYDRDSSAWMNLVTKGLTQQLHANGSERLRIDSNGRILVGPGAIATPKCGYAGIDVPNNDWAIIMGGSDGNGNRADNSNKDGRFAGAHYVNAEEPIGIIRCTSGSSASELHMGGGTSLVNAATQLSFYTAANTTTTTGTERLRIHADGVITMGSAHSAATNAEVTVRAASPQLSLYATPANVSRITLGDTDDHDIGQIGYDNSDNSMFFATNNSTRVSINSDGMVLVRSTTVNGGMNVFSSQGASTSANLILGQHTSSSMGNGTLSFLVYTNGNVVNSNNSYGSISDVSLKENIVDANSQWADIKGVRVRNYNFKEETGNETFKQLGVVAQEVEEVSPGLVNTNEDGIKSVNYSVLYMKAVKALQEAMTRIETLEAEVAALKG